ADGLQSGIEQHRRVAVEADQRAVLATHALLGAYDYGVVDLALLHLAARNGILHAHLDDVAHGGVAAPRATEHLDALDPPRARVVGHIQHRLHLNHGSVPSIHRGRQPAPHSSCWARSTMLTTRQDLRLEMGRHSRIATRSPVLHSLFSSCASTLLVRRTYFPYTGCLISRSIATATVLSIRSLTTRPMVGRCRTFSRTCSGCALWSFMCPYPAA